MRYVAECLGWRMHGDGLGLSLWGVKHRGKTVCECKTERMAYRIARALNALGE